MIPAIAPPAPSRRQATQETMTATIVLSVSLSAGLPGVVAVSSGWVASVPEGSVSAGVLSTGSVADSVGGVLSTGSVVGSVVGSVGVLDGSVVGAVAGGSVAGGVVVVPPVALFSTFPQTVQV